MANRGEKSGSLGDGGPSPWSWSVPFPALCCWASQGVVSQGERKVAGPGSSLTFPLANGQPALRVGVRVGVREGVRVGVGVQVGAPPLSWGEWQLGPNALLALLIPVLSDLSSRT